MNGTALGLAAALLILGAFAALAVTLRWILARQKRPGVASAEKDTDEQEPHAKRFFASYSHADVEIVKPVVELMRAGGVQVFRDHDNIPLGKRWRVILEEAVDEADVTIVFWSSSAVTSAHMREEYERAVETGKDVLPVLLDSTELPAILSEFQCLDFRPVCARQRALVEERLAIERRLSRLQEYDPRALLTTLGESQDILRRLGKDAAGLSRRLEDVPRRLDRVKVGGFNIIQGLEAVDEEDLRLREKLDGWQRLLEELDRKRRLLEEERARLSECEALPELEHSYNTVLDRAAEGTQDMVRLVIARLTQDA
jgi:hypothetical protein